MACASNYHPVAMPLYFFWIQFWSIDKENTFGLNWNKRAANAVMYSQRVMALFVIYGCVCFSCRISLIFSFHISTICGEKKIILEKKNNNKRLDCFCFIIEIKNTLSLSVIYKNREFENSSIFMQLPLKGRRLKYSSENRYENICRAIKKAYLKYGLKYRTTTIFF